MSKGWKTRCLGEHRHRACSGPRPRGSRGDARSSTLARARLLGESRTTRHETEPRPGCTRRAGLRRGAPLLCGRAGFPARGGHVHRGTEQALGGAALLLARAVGEEQSSRIGNQTGGRVFLFLHTDDFWRDYRDLRSKGVEFVRGPSEESYGTVAVFKDLYGNLWDLVERRPSALPTRSIAEP
jgi:hypothetical protein